MTDEQYTPSPRTRWILYLRSEALRVNRPEVSTIAHVGIMYATFADWDGQNVFPGVGTLAAITGRSEDTVSRCLAALVGAGLIVRKRRQGGKSAMGALLAPLTKTTDWEPLLLPFSETRQAAYRRREKARKAADAAAAEESRNPSGDGFKNPSPSGDQDTVPVGGTEESVTRPRTGGQPVRGRVLDTVPVGGVLHQSSTSGRDTHPDRTIPEVVAQPQVRAGEAAEQDHFSPGLQAIEGGGRGAPGGQSPLLLSVHAEPTAPADLTRIADHMSELYGVILPRRYAAPVAMEILGDLQLPDPTAYVLAALSADPDAYRPPLPTATAAPQQRAAGDS